MTPLEKLISEIRERAEAFTIYGTADCPNCVTGRVTMFVKSQSCLSCRTGELVQTSDVSDVPKLLAALKLAIRQRDNWLSDSFSGVDLQEEINYSNGKIARVLAGADEKEEGEN